MQRIFLLALAISALGLSQASAQPMQQTAGYYGSRAPAQYQQPDLGGGFIEFLFRGPAVHTPRYQRNGVEEQAYQPPVQRRHIPELEYDTALPPARMYVHRDPAQMVAPQMSEPVRPQIDPRYLKQVVNYDGNEKPGTIVIDTPRRFLYLVQDDGKALRYGIGVGRPGFSWAGVKHVTRKAEWPDWRPPAEMLKRRPDLPTFMAGGPANPLGARALYLGSSLYRIHGSNEPWTIGQAVSSGCIRMRNEDVIDLYERVKVGTRVIVI